MATQKKIDTVTTLTEKIGKAKSMVFADYRGLKHKQLEELRRLLKKVESEFVVTKNRLMLRSLGDKKEAAEGLLSDSTAVLFAYNDEVSPLKELLKFFKTVGVGSAKGGLLGDKAVNAEEVARLAALPSHEVLLGRLVGQLNAPIQGLHYALNWNINKLVWALNSIKNSKSS